MTPTYFTGLDLHKRPVTATTLGATAKLPCRAPALRAYFAQIPGDHAATVECTTGWYWVRDALADEGDLRLAHAKGVRAIAAAKVKTDAADAKMLAHLLRADLLPEAHLIADDMRPLRDVLRTRLRLVERRVAAQNSIARLLEKHNIGGGAGAGRQGDRADRVPRAHEAGGLQRPVQGHAPEPDEAGAMAPTPEPGQHNWRWRGLRPSTALGGNGRGVGVPPTEIWDDVPSASVVEPTVRARMGVWPAGARPVAARPI